jgi:hypothetical protein
MGYQCLLRSSETLIHKNYVVISHNSPVTTGFTHEHYYFLINQSKCNNPKSARHVLEGSLSHLCVKDAVKKSTILSSHLHHKSLEKQTKNTLRAQYEHTYPMLWCLPDTFWWRCLYKRTKYCGTTPTDINRGDFLYTFNEDTHRLLHCTTRNLSFISYNPQSFRFI